MKSGKVVYLDLMIWLNENYPDNWEWTGESTDNMIVWTKDSSDIIGHYVYIPGVIQEWELGGLISQTRIELAE